MTDGPARRPTTIEGVQSALAGFRSAEGDAHAARFRPRPSDVIIATYPKCGSTWMQQIVHGLRTGGSMDFDEITEAVPWIEMAYDLGHDLEADQAAEPRAFKSHWRRDEVPEGCRYICILRDPKDVMVSFYRFFEGWFFEPGSISLDALIREFILQGTRSGRYWDHILAAWAYRDRADTLLLAYEDMKAAPRRAVARVAEFLDFGGRLAKIHIATEQSSIEFMKRHERQFDDHLIRAARDAACGLPPGGDATKVREGRVGGHKAAMSADLAAALDQVWREEIESRLGFADYQALREALPGD